MGERIAIEMPSLSADGESATLASWLVGVGDPVEAGALIAELETDKATVELEAPAEGVLAEIRIEAGTEDLAPGTVLGFLEVRAPRDEAPGEAPTDDAPAPTPPVQAETPAPVEAAAPEAATVTPLARRLAEQSGLDPDRLVGSGARGRVVEADVRLAARAGSASLASVAPLAPLATEPPAAEAPRTVGVGTAVSRLRIGIDLTRVGDLVERLNAPRTASGDASAPPVEAEDFILKAAALASRDVPWGAGSAGAGPPQRIDLEVVEGRTGAGGRNIRIAGRVVLVRIRNVPDDPRRRPKGVVADRR